VIRHIVFFKLNDKNDAKEVKEKLLTLKEKVDVVQYLEVGINFADEARAYDLSLIVDVKTKDDLEKYAKDEYHQEVIKYIKTKANDTKVVDYES
jgi:electron transfer flavoprotein alpha subunit